VIHAGDQNAHDAQDANTAAFIYLGNQNCTKTYAGTKDLVGANLVEGVYCADAFALSGTLTLKGSGVWIFKSSADLNTTGTAKVVGGDPCNVWWREVSSASLGVGTQFIGNILASTSISLKTNARLNGRALAQTGEVSMDSNIITGPICGTRPIPTSKPTSKPKSTNVPSSEQTATALASERTATALGGLPGLPNTGGGAPIQDEDFPWSLVFVGGLSAMALVLGVRAFRRTYRQRP
jgi:type VI secretion system secreted protein VgrG